MDWTASWIWHPSTGSDDNFYLYARRELALEKPPVEAHLFITAGSLYKLYVNGRYVGRGPNPSDPSRYYYDVHPVSSYLKPGANVIAVVAYTYGPKAHGVLGQNWGRGGLLAELRAPGRDGKALLVTDGSWRVIQAPPWDQGSQVNCTLLGDYKEIYDSRREIDGWMAAGFDDKSWKKPEVLGRPPVEPYTGLVEREIPLFKGERVRPLNAAWESASVTYAWRDDWEVYHEQRLAPLSPHRSKRDLEKPVLVKKTHPDYTPAVTLDFGRDVTGYPEIRIAGSKGGVIDVLYAEDQYFVRVDRFILRGGPQVLQPFNRRTFRFMKLVFAETPDEIQIEDVSMEMQTYPADMRAAGFVCSDERLNRIWEVGRYTMRMSMLDHFVDCPWRERTLYGGDLYAENLIAHYAFGDPRMNRKCLRQMFHIQYPEGALPPYGPYRGCDGFYPSWSAFFGLGFIDHYRLSGDRAFLDELWPRFTKLVEWTIAQLERTEHYLMGGPERGGKFEQWMQGPRVRFDPWQNFPFQKMLMGAADLAAVRGEAQNAARWRQAGTKMADSLRGKLVDPASGTVVPFGGDVSRRHHSGQYDTALMLWCGLLPEGDALAMARRLFAPTIGRINAPFHGLFVTEGLFAVGEDTAAVDFVRRFWGEMIELGHGTFFDNHSLDWAKGSQVDRQTSLCHGWAAGPTYSLPANVLGVKPLEPGFAQVSVKPFPGDLSWAAGKVPTPLGPVEVSWQRGDTRFRIELVVPEGCAARVELPPFRGRERQVRLDGSVAETTYEGGRQTLRVRQGRHVIEQAEPDMPRPPSQQA